MRFYRVVVCLSFLILAYKYAAEVSLENEYMRLALNEAALAEASGDIPVGAVIVKNGVVIATPGKST